MREHRQSTVDSRQSTVDSRDTAVVDDAAAGPADLVELVALLETVSERIDDLDALSGGSPSAAEDRTIQRTRAHLARDEARQVRADVGEVRQRARALAGLAASLRATSAHLVGHRHRPDPGVLTALRAAQDTRSTLGREGGGPARLAELARSVTHGVRWAQIAVPSRHGVVCASSGELPVAVVRALEDGPRAAVLADGEPVSTDDGDAHWPLSVGGDGDVRSVLVLPLGDRLSQGGPSRGAGGPSRGALVLAAAERGAFDPGTREAATLLARSATTELLARDDVPPPDAVEARDVLDGVCAVLRHHLRLDQDAVVGLLLETARVAGEPVLVVAHRLLDTLVLPPGRADPSDDGPATLRRAVAHMERHAVEDIGLDDITAVAGVGSRALQQVFRRHLDTTPLEYLRTVRLDRARAELRAAGPASGATVSGVAARWHFTHPGRFSVLYRERYGENPSVTLRS
jgi:AraC-like DNA-binding protein